MEENKMIPRTSLFLGLRLERTPQTNPIPSSRPSLFMPVGGEQSMSAPGVGKDMGVLMQTTLDKTVKECKLWVR